MNHKTSLFQQRLQYHPPLPKVLENLRSLSFDEREAVSRNTPFLLELFPHTKNLARLHLTKKTQEMQSLRVGVVFSGGQAPGGHNVVTGLFDALQALHSDSQLIGFLGGPGGLVEGKYRLLNQNTLATYRNMGGFDLIGSGRTKIEKQEQFEKARTVVEKEKLDGLVIIGGDDSNTNAAFLAEFFLAHEMHTCVVGIPKTIDGDLKNEAIEISFGFDTATKTYADTIGSVLRDAISAKKYYFFIRLMGRSASHVTLECAMQTHPNITLIGEEIAEKKQTLKNLTDSICDVIEKRSSQGKEYGVILIPEGIVEFIPECKELIRELNHLLAKGSRAQKEIEAASSLTEKISMVENTLSLKAQACFKQIPQEIQTQLLLDRDPHGNVQVAKIESERLFLQMVNEELKKRKKAGSYQGKFSAQPLYLGYEGRSCYPSNFDANYGNALGYVAALLIRSKKTGYMASVQNVVAPASEWLVSGIPIVEMLTLETREGKEKAVIEKALVELSKAPFQTFAKQRSSWEQEDSYIFPGPIQFFGPAELTDQVTHTLLLERQLL